MCTTLYITKERKIHGCQLIQISKVVRVSGDRRRTGALHSKISPSQSGFGTTGLKEAEQPYSGREWAPVATAL